LHAHSIGLADGHERARRDYHNGKSVLFYECSDAARKDNHGHIPALDHRVIEPAQIELVTQRVLRLRPQAVDLAVPDFVSASLARPGAIAINLAAHFLDT